MGCLFFNISLTVGLLLISACELESNIPNPPKIKGIEGEVQWVKGFGGSKNDLIQKIIQTKDGGYAMIGYSDSKDGDLVGSNGVENNLWLVKLDKDGNKQWSKTYGGSKDDRGQSLVQTEDGSYVVVGYAKSSDGDSSQNKGMHDVWALKIDDSGTILWQNSFGFMGHDHGHDLVATQDGGFVLTGFLDVTASGGKGRFGMIKDGFQKRGEQISGGVRGMQSGLHGVGEYWVLKIDKDGKLVWSRFFGGSENDKAYGIAKSSDGGFILTGFSESKDFDIGQSKKGSYDFWCVKIDKRGEKIWEESFGGSGIDEAYDIAPTRDGAFVVVGKTFSNDGQVGMNLGNSDAWIIKISSYGELIWTRGLGGDAFDEAKSVYANNANSIFIIGNTRSKLNGKTQKGGSDVLVAQFDNRDGELLWHNTFGSSSDDEGLSILQQENGEVIIAGTYKNADFHKNLAHKGEKDVFVMKLK